MLDHFWLFVRLALISGCITFGYGALHSLWLRRRSWVAAIAALILSGVALQMDGDRAFAMGVAALTLWVVFMLDTSLGAMQMIYGYIEELANKKSKDKEE